MIRTFSLAIAFSALLLIAPSNASAYWGNYGCGAYPWGGYSWGWGTAFNSNYGWNYVPPPPYFAVHPPVYYSPYITARHYGASPYAGAGGMQPSTYVAHSTPADRPAPLMVQHPYVTRTKQARSETEKSETQPVHIENPYFASALR